MYLTVIVAMLMWNWKLLLATGVGVGIMVLVYSMQYWRFSLRWSDLQRWLNGPNRQLTLAVASGVIATLTTYMAATVWSDSDSAWLAAGSILQGLGTLLTIILLVWQIVNFYTQQQESKFDELLVKLTHTDPLERLIAVRQVSKLVTRDRIDSMQQTTMQCLQLLLLRETETVIREAVLDSLQALEALQPLAQPQPTGKPLSTPVVFKPVAEKLKLND